MGQPVEITVRSQLLKVSKELDEIITKFEAAENNIKKTGEAVDDQVRKSARNAQEGVGQQASFMKRAFAGLKDDVKALLSVQSLAGGLKLSSTMRGAVTDTIALTDTVRKLSGVFKIASGNQASFVSSLTKGLGDIGLGSDAAERALQGLSETQVRGQGALQAYALTAGQLAGATNQRGQEGGIAQGLAGVLQAQGKDVNDTGAMQGIATQVARAHNATGASATDVLSSMQEMFSSMDAAFKGRMTPSAMTQLEVMGKVGGKGSTDFIRSYLGTNSQTRSHLDALGFGKLFGENGVNADALKGIMGRAKQVGLGGNAAAGLTNLGLDDAQAKGLVLLYDNLEAVNRAAKEVADSTKTLGASFEQTKTMGEAFKGNFDKVKSAFSKPIAAGTGFITDSLKGTQKSMFGAGAVVGSSALLAGALTRVGLGGIGSALGIKGAQERILEGQGEKAQPVRVTNPDEIGAAVRNNGLIGTALATGLAGGALAAQSTTASNLLERAGVAAVVPGGAAIPQEWLDRIGSAFTTAIRKTVLGIHGPEFRKSPPASTGSNNSGVK